ncbi:hypothetical protein [Jeotgalibacillus campisalis]|uniref:Uncharacterized protein n=1 Tax=Jeotgalibacillus campisalis TaxID=220754 RepID=A0A0C2RMW6_9BACL|nr:hypothetical protein [Jeotgalibacillus campisalis]KIL43109.1 hypothetical protein KR50_35120 [Jeotgalibacillus campisalis]
MEKGIFARYKNKTFRVSTIDGETVRLVSEESNISEGFKELIYPSNYKDRNNLPTLYIKEVKKVEIEEIYEVDYKAKFRGEKFNLSFNKAGSEFRLGTMHAELANQYGFERTDKYYYEKIVNENEIEVIEVQKKL